MPPVDPRPLLLAIALVVLGCGVGCGGGGSRHARCGAFGACPSGLSCVHGGPANLGTCESRCARDADCPPGLRCVMLPPADALPFVCAAGSRASADEVTLLDVRENEGSLELIGPATPGTSYALIGPEPSLGIARVLGPSPTDCDHCPGPRWRLWAMREPPRPVRVAVGPLSEPLPAARARVIEQEAPPGPTWATTLVVDLDDDGHADVERVVRCDRTIRSGCDDEVCDRICHATRTIGAADVRGSVCVSFIPDLEDCEP